MTSGQLIVGINMPNSPNRSHSETIRLTIEREIVEGILLPGAPLDEASLSARFKVSRTPVREAILQLIQAGLVEKRSRQGSFVARADLSRIILMFEVMSELEGICAKLAARRMSDAERAALRETHERTVKAFEDGDESNYFRLSRRFHVHVIDGSHNDVLIETTNKIGLPLVPYRHFQLRYPGRFEANLRDHAGMLKAILDGNSDEAYALFRKHTTLHADLLADYVSHAGMRPAARSSGRR